jgi:hypothetical protein
MAIERREISNIDDEWLEWLRPPPLLSTGLARIA